MKKFGRALVAAMMASLMFTTTVFAVPSASELRQDKKETEEKIESLEKQMTSVMKKINETEQELVKVGQEIIKATEDLEEAEETEKQQYEAMKRRIVAMYENGNSSMITMILEAGSVADMLCNTVPIVFFGGQAPER